MPKILTLRDDLHSGWNVDMVLSDLFLIREEMTKHLDILDGIDKSKFLPPSMFRKKKEMCKALNETVKSVNSIVDQAKK